MRLKQKKGFTLLEVILAITIMSTLAVLSTQAITCALRARSKIQSEVDDVSALRDSARIMRTDINMAFHHRDVEKEILDLATKPATSQTLTPGAPSGQLPFGSDATRREAKREDPTTHFVGNESEMGFVTLNSGRLTSAAAQADFIEVGYALRDCKNLTTGKSSKCIYRRVQNIIDDDVAAGGNETVMLENVTEFKLRYIGETKQDWVSSWSSKSGTNDSGTIGRYPDAVEVSMGIEREFEGKKRAYSLQLVIPVHFPNNPNKASGSSAGSGSGSGSAPPQGGVIDQ